MSRSITQTETRGAASTDTRCVIMSTAEHLFREIGYRKTTVADIAKALRMSSANVYRFFESKKAINEAVADRMLAEMEAELLAIVERPNTSATTRLADFIRTLNRLSTERLITERRMHEMVEVAMAESWQIVARHITSIDTMLCRLVDDGCRSGEFSVDDPLVAGRCVHSAIIRFCHPGLIVQCADEPGPTLDEMVAFVVCGLRGTAEDSSRR